jgi:DNA-binding transcriptional LysR family regulator
MATTLEDWNLLRTFLAVFETGNLTRAAQQLGLTQPSAGRHLRALEDQLGETLFDRVPGKWRPTARASGLYEAAVGMRKAAAAANEVLAGHTQQLAGRVRISSSEAFSIGVLPQLLAALMRDAPALEIELVATNNTDNLLRRDADLALRFYRPAQDDLVATRVGSVEVGLYASRAYLARCGMPSRLSQAGHVWIGYDQSRVALDSPMGRRSNLQREQFQFRTDSVLAQQAAIEADLGIGPYLVPLAEAHGGLQRVLPDVVAQPLEIWLCAHDDLRRSLRLRRCFDYLEQALRARFG